MSPKSFTAQLQDFAKLTTANMKYVAAESIQDVVEAAQTPQPSVKRTGGAFEEGKIPVDTSDLINSLSVNGGAPGAESYTVALADFDIGDVMTFEWTAEYAMRIEAGFVGEDELGREYNQAGRHFVGANAARFPEFVKAREAEVR